VFGYSRVVGVKSRRGEVRWQRGFRIGMCEPVNFIPEYIGGVLRITFAES